MDRVLIQRVIPKTKTMGGILLPEQAQSKINEVFLHLLNGVVAYQWSYTSQGVVIAVGGGARATDGSIIPVCSLFTRASYFGIMHRRPKT